MQSAACPGRRFANLLLPWLLVLLGLLVQSAHAQSTDEPLILVAVPQLGGFYHHSVVVAVPIEGKRHVGFIINRPTEVSMGRLFPGHDASRKVSSPIFLGGPEMVNSVFAMLKADDSPGGKSFAVMPGVQVVAEARSIDRIIEQTPDAARYYAGFVAWQPGELELELERGFWFTMPAQADLMFRHDVGSMWQELLERSRRVRTQLPGSDSWERAPGIA
ncbi:MAG: YqgE/AlgH family protein [Burkholderiales bacterium]|nr:YqgE/AlgH family protein [Burkholderiales bacterium]